MRARLFGLVLVLMAVALLALGVPLAVNVASVHTQRTFLDRLNDANRFVVVAQQDRTGDASLLASELARYDQVYGIPAAMVDRRWHVRAASRPGFDAASLSGHARRLVAMALSGHHGEPPGAVLPWSKGPMVVAEPVIEGGEVVGAVVTLSPTGRVKRAVARSWLVLGLAELAAVAACLFLASRLTRWVLRPVRDLDVTAHEIATGRMAARVPNGTGPRELQRLVHSFNEMAGNVETLVERQRSFLADASHQLRNPLHALMLRLDSLSMRAQPAWAAEADAAAGEGRYLARILDSLLDLARAEHAESAPRRVDLVPIVDGRIAAWSAAARSRDMTVRRGGDPSVEALADDVAAASALDAVLDNAVKFGPPGTTVSVSVRGDGGEALVCVRDEGPGLGADEIRRAGDRFWRARRHQNVAGSGLGLAVARTLLEHGGARLDIRPGDPRGLEVVLRFSAPSQRQILLKSARRRPRL